MDKNIIVDKVVIFLAIAILTLLVGGIPFFFGKQTKENTDNSIR